MDLGDGLHEAQEFVVEVAVVALAGGLAARDLQGGEQGCAGAVADVVVGGRLVHAEHDGVLRR